MTEKRATTTKDAEQTMVVNEALLARLIYRIRGINVMFDADLAKLYEVQTKVFLQAVKRNINRIPEDFMFQLTKEELENWRSQIVTSNPNAKMGLRRRPYAFAEQGAAMLSSVLRSERAIQVNLFNGTNIYRTIINSIKTSTPLVSCYTWRNQAIITRINCYSPFNG